MLLGPHGLGDDRCPLQLDILFLAVAEAEAMTLKAPAAGYGQNRAGIQPAAEKNNCFFHGEIFGTIRFDIVRSAFITYHR